MTPGVFKDTVNNTFVGIADISTWNFTVENPVYASVDDEKIIKAGIFPNPSNGRFIIEVDEALKGKKVEMKIFNIVGQEVYNRMFVSINGQERIELDEAMPNGIYIINLFEGRNKFTERIVIDK